METNEKVEVIPHPVVFIAICGGKRAICWTVTGLTQKQYDSIKYLKSQGDIDPHILMELLDPNLKQYLLKWRYTTEDDFNYYTAQKLQQQLSFYQSVLGEKTLDELFLSSSSSHPITVLERQYPEDDTLVYLFHLECWCC